MADGKERPESPSGPPADPSAGSSDAAPPSGEAEAQSSSPGPAGPGVPPPDPGGPEAPSGAGGGSGTPPPGAAGGPGLPPGADHPATAGLPGPYGHRPRAGFLAWTARRPVQLVAVGLAGALVGGALVGFFEAFTHGDDHHHRHAVYGRMYGPGPFMRGPGWRLRQWDGTPPWQQRLYPQPVPTAPSQAPTPGPTATVTVTPTPKSS